MSTDPSSRPGADPFAAASGLDAGEEDPDVAATAALPGHGVDEVVEPTPTGPRQDPPIAPPAHDHPAHDRPAHDR